MFRVLCFRFEVFELLEFIGLDCTIVCPLQINFLRLNYKPETIFKHFAKNIQLLFITMEMLFYFAE